MRLGERAEFASKLKKLGSRVMRGHPSRDPARGQSNQSELFKGNLRTLEERRKLDGLKLSQDRIGTSTVGIGFRDERVGGFFRIGFEVSGCDMAIYYMENSLARRVDCVLGPICALDRYSPTVVMQCIPDLNEELIAAAGGHLVAGAQRS